LSTEQQQLEAAILGLESQRALLGDAVADAAIVPLRAKLAALVAAQPDGGDQTLKQVTILFLDVVGSTNLSQHLDAEDTHAIMDGALSRCTAIVAQHHGKVLQYAGDSVLAVFGADEAREDDAERAVKAGLALLEEGKRQGALVRQRHGHDGFDVRVGVHTGGVLLGGGVEAEGGIRGLAVNIAARMEQTAPAGALRISHDTYAQVRGVFDVEPQPPIPVKGVDEPIVTYLVQRTKPRAFRVTTRGIEGIETRMVGRDAELEELQEAFKRLYRGDAQLGVVTVVADAGLGKSRLLYEFENWAEARAEAFYIFQGRAQPQTQSQPYGLLRDILAWRLQIADDDSMAEAKRKIEQGIVPLFQTEDGDDLAEAHAHLLGHLVGLDFTESRHIRGIRDDGKQIRNRGFHAAAQVFRRVVARDGLPIVLLLDDLHWADDGSLDFLNYLTQVNRDVPMLLLGLSRPTLFERRADWPSMAGAQRIDLSPLDRNASRQLAKELLKKLAEVPAALRELITGGAEGNPFYMEELVKMLVDEGAIVTGGERWTVVPDKLLATKVPPTLTGVLQARLDSLPPTERLALQQASVVGLVFWDQALAAIDAKAVDAIPSLVQRELSVAHQDAGLDGVREYAFKHQILHQVTYDTVLKRTRRDTHAKVAAWLAGLTGARANDFLGATAEHYEQAGETARAGEFFARAAEQATGRYAHEAALDYVARALAVLGDDAGPDGLLLRWRLLDVRERTLDLQGRRPEQRAEIDALGRVAEALDDDDRRGEVAWRRGDFAMRTADPQTQASAARETMALAERTGNTELRLRGLQRLAQALNSLGDTAAAKVLAQDGLAETRARGLRLLEGRFHNTLGWIAHRQGDLIATIEADRQHLSVARELADRQSECVAVSNLGASLLDLGDYAQGQRYLDESLRLAQMLGGRSMGLVVLTNLARLALWQGDDALALAQARSALDTALAIQDPRNEAVAHCQLGNAELALGRHAAAMAAFERAHSASQTLDDPIRYDAAAGLARVALARGDTAGALAAVDDMLSHLAGGGTLDGAERRALARLTCHQVLASVGDPRAADLLAAAHAELQAQAAAITDPALRASFLNNIPEHREIVAAWAATQGSGHQANA
jgi:class 3 adenylate cyclase/tetratricopeptide (TPR) repeat protein